jgi:hypothetical protein
LGTSALRLPPHLRRQTDPGSRNGFVPAKIYQKPAIFCQITCMNVVLKHEKHVVDFNNKQPQQNMHACLTLAVFDLIGSEFHSTGSGGHNQTV